MLQQMATLQRTRAVELDGRVDDGLRRLRREELRHRGAPGHIGGAVVVRLGRRVHQQPGRLGAGRHLGDLVGDGLEVLERAAERRAACGVLDRGVEGRLRHADGEGADAGTEQVEGVHGNAEAAVGLAEHVVPGDPYAVEGQGPDRVRREHLQRLSAEPRPVGRYEEGGHPTGARALGGAGEDGAEVGLGGVGDPALLAGQPPSFAVRFGPQREGGRVRAGVRLAQREGGDGAARDDLGEPSFLLGAGAGLDDRVRAEALEGECGLGLGAAVGERFAQQAQFQRARSEEAGEEAALAESGDQGAVHPARFALLRQRAERLGRQGAQLRTPGGLCRIEREYGHSCPHFDGRGPAVAPG